MWNKIKAVLPTYLVAIAIPLGVGLLSTLLTFKNMDIYSEIVKPPFSPPGWLFPIVWTLLYILMGISSGTVYLVRDLSPTDAVRGLRSYGISLVFNFFWSIIFFNMRSFLFAFLWLLLLLYFVVKSMLYYRKVSPVSAYLQIPYVVWLLIAGYLNAGVYVLN